MAAKRERSTTVHLTRRTYDALRRRAQDAGKDPDALAEEFVKQAMAEPKPQPLETEREHIRRIMREDGITVDPKDYGFQVDPNVDYEALRQELAAIRVDPPLSQTIIEERHSK